MSNLIFYPVDIHYNIILEYLYDNYPDKITDFVYSSECSTRQLEYRHRRSKDRLSVKSILPHDCNFSFHKELDEEDTVFQCQLEVIYKGIVPETYNHSLGHEGGEDRILKRLTLSSSKKEALVKLIDVAKEAIKKKHEENKKSNCDTIRIYYFRKEYWNMLAKAPKRSIDTLYLKEGEKETLVSMVQEFFHDETRDVYLSFGMPYKHIVMLYGVPGSGKTSTITALASHFDCDIYTIPITKELTDYGLIDAFSYINDKEDKKRIIVLEDIDCMFDCERKEGDDNNMITLQALLNCLDGHTCVEGTLLFMTANRPEKMDSAMVRSCRIDYKLKLGYADEYQTKAIYDTFLPKQGDHFRKFYKKVSHMDITTAMLQEFLFYNRKCDNILDHMKQFTDIVDKNKPSELSSEKKDDNLYM
jgi:SpoVK/Ycf46/Vps4 family AAA+-type ATPase